MKIERDFPLPFAGFGGRRWSRRGWCRLRHYSSRSQCGESRGNHCHGFCTVIHQFDSSLNFPYFLGAGTNFSARPSMQ